MDEYIKREEIRRVYEKTNKVVWMPLPEPPEAALKGGEG